MEFTYQNLNIATIGLSRVLLNSAIRKESRGTVKYELPEPLMVHIKNPVDRYINIPVRKYNKVLPFAESLSLAAGTNALGLFEGYASRMRLYSDDKLYMRAAYGPRIRAFTGANTDYTVDAPYERTFYSGSIIVVDQLKFVIETLQKDIYSQQAVIMIGDPGKDCYQDGKLIETKDMPCCRQVQFMVVDGRLDCIMFVRSNDFVYGFQAVNVFNWTMMQEYIANILKIDIGTYHHVATSFHYYEDKRSLLEHLAREDENKYFSEFAWPGYKSAILDLNHFDENITRLFNYEEQLRGGHTVQDIPDVLAIFYDWYKVFKQHWTKQPQVFLNPYLKRLFNAQ